MSIRMLALAITLATTAILFAAEPDTPIAIRRDAHVITATGLTAGGRSAIIISWRRDSAIAETWTSGTADASGTFSAAFPIDAPPGGLVAVADVESGRLQIDTGDGSFFQRVDLPEIRLKRNNEREVEEIASPSLRTLSVVVRRGDGAWVVRGFDGSVGDADGEPNGGVKLVPGSMTPTSGSAPPPHKLKKQDSVLIIDQTSRTYASTEVSE